MKQRYVVGTVIGVVACIVLIYLYGGSQVPAGQPPLHRLTADSVSTIKNEFNSAKGEARVLLLLSPT
jgi:hypothetical protein